MGTQVKVNIVININNVCSNAIVDIGWKSDRSIVELDDAEVFLLSESIRTALIHDNELLHDMTKEIIKKTKNKHGVIS